MTFRLFTDEVDSLVKKCLEKIGHPNQEYNLLEPPRHEFGDLSCNVAFLISKKIKKSPYEVALEVAAEALSLNKTPAQKNTYLKSIEIHPSGYINFRANLVELGAVTLMTILLNDTFGFEDIGKGLRVILEHTSINPNKALHVGHLRNVILGDTLYRLLKQTNHQVVVMNYIDDSGLQVADIIVGFVYAGFPLDPPDKNLKFDKYCGEEIYVKVNRLYNSDPSLLEKRNLVLRKLDMKDEEIYSLASNLTMKVLDAQLRTCWRVKSRYDLLIFESHILHSSLWQQVFELVRSEGIILHRTQGKNLGCWVYLPEVGSTEKVIIRSDGTSTYIAKDISFAGLKVGLLTDPFEYYIFCNQWDGTSLWSTAVSKKFMHQYQPKFTRANFFPGKHSITLVDDRQKKLQGIVKQIVEKSGVDTPIYMGLVYAPVTITRNTAIQLGLEIEEESESVNMSGRSGISVSADFVLDLLFHKAWKGAKERNPSFSEIELDRIAEDIAISALRYNLLKYDTAKIVKFDLEESLSLRGDSGPYIQYTYARICSLILKSGNENSIDIWNHDIMIQICQSLSLTEESDLLKLLSKFELVISESVKNYEPKFLVNYLHRLASNFNIYYERIPIVKESVHNLAVARITLTKAIGVIISKGLKILGMSPLERM